MNMKKKKTDDEFQSLRLVKDKQGTCKIATKTHKNQKILTLILIFLIL